MPEPLTRRTFIDATGATLAAGAALAPKTVSAAPATSSGSIPRRKFGRHPDMVSALGIGGHHLGDAATEQEAVAIVHEAIDAGANFFDNAWEYNNHRSEEWLGAGFRGGYRDKAFVMTKVCTHGRDAAIGMEQLEESLRRLGTDHLDLWQIHAVTYDNDPELAYRRGGVIEALDKAKRQGKVRYVGFTGHKNPDLHLKMLELGYPFDAIQMPLNPFDGQFLSFAQNVVPVAVKRGIAVLGMKPFGGTGAYVSFGRRRLAARRGDALRDERARGDDNADRLRIARRAAAKPRVRSQFHAAVRGPDGGDSYRRRTARRRRSLRIV